MVLRLTTYGDALNYLFARTTGATKLGLERTEALLDALGNPHDRLVAFHIAGTNGKGSVAAILERLLSRMGLRVGKYTSPHLVDFRERILIDGRMVDAETVVEYVDRWTPTVERIGATFFEATTALAFSAFARADVDVVVIETGLGGRLDATNVLVPRVAAVTNIGLDHTEYLGNTLAEIAAEKGGIFKRGVPAVVGERTADLRNLLEGIATSAGASRVVAVADEFVVRNVEADTKHTEFRLQSPRLSGTARLGLRGEHQVWNACTALAALEAAGDRYRPSSELIATGLADLSLAGRCQVEGNFIFDVAHNPDGARVLAATLKQLFPNERFTVLLCVLSDKDWSGVISQLAPVAGHFVFTDAPTAPDGRRWDLAEVSAFGGSRGVSHEVVPDFDAALGRVAKVAGRVLITGSFHTVGDAMSRLKVSPVP